MKTIKVDGSIYAVVESDNFCDGCIFHSVTWCGAVNIPEIQCDADLREDGQHVIFEKLEELKAHTEYPVGKVLTFRGSVVEVVDDNEKSCEGCVCYNRINCNHIHCMPFERMDDNFVKLKKYVTED